MMKVLGISLYDLLDENRMQNNTFLKKTLIEYTIKYSLRWLPTPVINSNILLAKQ
jgi:hypothetical protein